MIVRFNPELFESKADDELVSLLKMILGFVDDTYHWELDNIFEIFVDQEGDLNLKHNFGQNYLPQGLLQRLDDKIGQVIHASAYITAKHQKYLSKIEIGNGEGEIAPGTALRMLEERSYIVVENATNDGNFIKGLLINYIPRSEFSSIYELVKQSLENSRLVFDHAGGGGGIEMKVRLLMENELKGVAQEKLIVIFDSDRKDSATINAKNKNLLIFLKGRGFDQDDVAEFVYIKQDEFLWHMSYKREMENYVPLDTMFQKFPDIPKDVQRALTDGDDEFRDFYKFNTVLPEDAKSSVPQLFLKNGLYDSLEKKCAHHQVKIELPNDTLKDVSEIEDILIKIAKII